MAFDVTESQKVDDNGIAITDADDNILGYVIAGSGDPTGIAAPVSTLYLRSDVSEIWLKFGAAATDWAKQEVKPGIIPRRIATDLTVGSNDQLVVAENVCIEDNVLIDLEDGAEVNVL